MAFTRSDRILTVDLSRKGLPVPLAAAATRCLNRLLGFEQFNSVYSRLPPCDPKDFSRTLLDALQVRVDVDGQSWDALPKDGPLLVVANHPTGLLDGVLLDALLGSVRPDVTVMAHILMAAIPEYRDRVLFVGRPRSRSKRKLNMRSLRQSFQWLAGGGALIVHPAGRVSRFQFRRRSVADQPWSSHIAALARQTGAPVLPVYLHGLSDWGFQLAGIISPLLQNVRGVGAVSRFRNQTLRATIGRLILPGELSGFVTDDEAIAFLRQETDRLARS